MASKVSRWVLLFSITALLLILLLYFFNGHYSPHLNSNIHQVWENIKAKSRSSAQQSIECATQGRGVHQTSQVVINRTNGEHTLLLVVIPSAYNRKARRDAIRETWKNSYVEQGKQFLVKFVIGTTQLNATEKGSVSAENRQHNDLVLLTDHMDSYNNLTRKVLQMFLWADKKVNYSYILKLDDDSFARLDIIESELKARQSTKGLYWGHHARNNVLTRGKWKEDKWFLCDKYLPYAVGAGYVLSADLVHRIVVNADALTLYHNEDVSVGVWTSSFNIERKYDERFEFRPKSVCKNSYIVMHHQTIDNFREKHNLMTTKGVPCNH